ncbi:hypothetical protein [Gordonia sp. DT101]|uniref:hypothetical protein n=1 Tax=Gordonia sp. DT101 TaxID=3416545 RepID=UPI003CE970EA
MRDEIRGLPREYLCLLRYLSQDPEMVGNFPAGAIEEIARKIAGDQAPADPIDMSYQRCCADRIARNREIERRVQNSVDEWFAEPHNSVGRIHGTPRSVYADIRAYEEHAFLAELTEWRRRHPHVPFDV